MKKPEDRDPYLTRTAWIEYDWWETEMYMDDFKEHMRSLQERIIKHPNGHIFNRI